MDTSGDVSTGADAVPTVIVMLVLNACPHSSLPVSVQVLLAVKFGVVYVPLALVPVWVGNPGHDRDQFDITVPAVALPIHVIVAGLLYATDCDGADICGALGIKTIKYPLSPVLSNAFISV